MKEVRESFFDVNNFIKSKIDYNNLKKCSHICHICYNVNDNFISIMGASMISVLENNKDMMFAFHIFTDGISEDNKNKLKDVAQRWQCRCIIYCLNMSPFQDFHIKVKRFSRITYARLYMPKIIKQYSDKFIYLDADTMCVSSLAELWNFNLEKPMAAVSERESAIKYRADYLKLKSGKYFNDGVMLINVSKWENAQITERCFSYQCEPPKRFLGQSQDILNLVFDGNNYFLPNKYNVYDGGEYDTGDSVIIHWTGRRKPWQMVLNSFDCEWRRYNRYSPWQTLTNILPIKNAVNYHDFKYWGIYHKEHGDYKNYIKGIFWYCILKIRYKL